jgi:hypothetical protein
MARISSGVRSAERQLHLFREKIVIILPSVRAAVVCGIGLATV